MTKNYFNFNSNSKYYFLQGLKNHIFLIILNIIITMIITMIIHNQRNFGYFITITTIIHKIY